MERRPRAHVLVFIFFGCLLLMRFEVLSAGYRIRPDDLACCQELEHNLMERWPRARPCQKMFSALPFTRHDLARALARLVFFTAVSFQDKRTKKASILTKSCRKARRAKKNYPRPGIDPGFSAREA